MKAKIFVTTTVGPDESEEHVIRLVGHGGEFRYDTSKAEKVFYDIDQFVRRAYDSGDREITIKFRKQKAKVKGA